MLGMQTHLDLEPTKPQSVLHRSGKRRQLACQESLCGSATATRAQHSLASTSTSNAPQAFIPLSDSRNTPVTLFEYDRATGNQITKLLALK